MTLPKGWAESQLQNVTSKIGSGATPRGGRESYGRGRVPLIRSMNVHFAGFDDDGLALIDETQAAALDNVAVKADDVLLNITGASIGRVCLAPSAMEGARVNQHVCIVRAAAVLPAYIGKFLSSPKMQSFILEENYGLTRQALTKGMVEQIMLPVPPAAEQRRIVAKLDALTARLGRARAELDRVPVLAAKLRQATLSAVRTDLRNAVPTRIEDVATSIFDGPFGSHLKSSDYSLNGVRVVRLENIGHLRFISDRLTFIPEDKYAGLTRHTLRAGDILFSSFVDRQVRVCRVPDDVGTAINKADCFVIRINAKLADPRLITYLLASAETYDLMRANVHGATRPRVALSHLRELVIPLPSREEQKKLADRLDAAFARADRLEAEAARARALIDRLEAAILAKAFRGELVPQHPGDEPASVLLDRIRAERAATPKPKRGRRVGSAPA